MVADGVRGGPVLWLEASDNSVLSHGSVVMLKPGYEPKARATSGEDGVFVTLEREFL